MIVAKGRTMLNVSCPHCTHRLSASDELAGQQARCGKCGTTFVISASQPAEVHFESIDPLSAPAVAVQRSSGEVSNPNVTAGWHYVRDGQSIGPLSAIQLRQMAISGQLQPQDLVWKQGMEDWVAAGKIAGLFDRISPPPIPGSASTPPSNVLPMGGPFGTQNQRNAIEPSTSVAPALWNPGAAGIWSLFIPWAMGPFLIAQNWRSLGESQRANRAMNWFYAALVFTASVPFLRFVLPVPIGGFVYLIGNPTALLIWNWAECESQRKLLKNLFANRYERRGLFFPILATIVLTIAWYMICNAVLFNSRVSR
jgi:ribosomal protein S27E